MKDAWRVLLVEAVLDGMEIVGMYTDPVVGGRHGEVLIAWAEVRGGAPLRAFTMVLGETAATGTFRMWFHDSFLVRDQVVQPKVKPHIDGNHALYASHHLDRFLRHRELSGVPCTLTAGQ